MRQTSGPYAFLAIVLIALAPALTARAQGHDEVAPLHVRVYPPTLAAKAQALETYLAGDSYDPLIHARLAGALAGEFFVAADYDGALQVLDDALDRLPDTGAAAPVAA
ncbi:MAG: hypothetical protein D6807_08710 [Alphaproteobacteria bacterium]|nr:MAG: hypothetical protein D6807_08710 [Alphaproteobacteria bacterium]